MLNRIILIGRLTKQPELRVTPGGLSVASFTLAVDRRPTQSGQKETDFIDVVVFGKLAEITCKYLDKGRQVAVEGRLQTRVYDTKDGQRRKAWEVIGDNVEFLGPRPAARGNGGDYDKAPEMSDDSDSQVEFTE